MGKRLSGAGNYLYLGTLGSLISGDGATPLAQEAFYKIMAIKASGTEWPASAVVNDIIYNKPALTPEVGDDAKLVTLVKLGFVSNIPQSLQKEKYKDTVQIDDYESYEEGEKPEGTGTIEGYFIESDSYVKQILSRFFRIVTDDGAGSRVYSQITTGALHFFLGRNETSTIGEVELMQYMPSIIDSLTIDKPMEGKQPFNFGYTIVGSERPNMYERTITA